MSDPKVATGRIEDLFEEKARQGIGEFAIAYAVLKLSHAQDQTAQALWGLGFNGPSPTFGALEGHTVKMMEEYQRLSSSVSEIAEALNGIKRVMRDKQEDEL